MPEVPLLKPSEVIYAFKKYGWKVHRQRGSHIMMVKEGHIATLSIPKHDQVARGTLRGLLKISGISLDDFLKTIR